MVLVSQTYFYQKIKIISLSLKDNSLERFGSD